MQPCELCPSPWHVQADMPYHRLVWSRLPGLGSEVSLASQCSVQALRPLWLQVEMCDATWQIWPGLWAGGAMRSAATLLDYLSAVSYPDVRP